MAEGRSERQKTICSTWPAATTEEAWLVGKTGLLETNARHNWGRDSVK